MRHYQRGIGTVIILVLLLIIGVAIASAVFVFDQSQKASVNSFEDCVKLYPVMESYPEQCNTPDGKHFVRELTEEDKQSLRSDDLKKKLIPPVEAPENTQDITEWKVYTNKKYGYSFSYPEEEFGFTEGLVSKPDGANLKTTETIGLVSRSGSTTGSLYFFAGDSVDSPGFGQPSVFDEGVKTKKISVGGAEALEAEDVFIGDYKRKQIGIVKEDYFFVIEAKPDFDDKARKIIETFKFLN